MIVEGVAMLRRRQGRLADAQQLLVEALDARRRLLGARHPYILEDVMKLGLVLVEQHQYAQAEATVRPILTGEVPRDEPWLLPEARSVLGGALAGLGRSQEAERELLNAYEALVALGTRIPAPERQAIGQTVDRLVAVYHALGNEERAAFWASRPLPR
jgi:Flp pilus assembly protein TadD